MKTCPYCAEEIQDEAILCRYCKKDLLQKKSLHSASPVPAYAQNKRNNSNAIIFFAGIIIIIIAYFLSRSTSPPITPTPRPRPTSTSRPTSSSYGISNIQTQVAGHNQPEGCYNWSEVTPLMIGKNICVTGIVHRNSPIAGTTTHITFTDDENKFFLASGTYYYPDVTKGDCVMAQGTVLQNTYHVPYIDIDNGLKNCN